MWNFLLSGLLTEAAVVLYDGSPGYPTLDRLWQFAEDARVTYLGTSAAFLSASQRASVLPREGGRLAAVRTIGSTGSVLSTHTFEWTCAAFGPDVAVTSLSGGTDVCTAFLGGVPGRPSSRAELSARWLGCKVESFDEAGDAVTGQVGELVVTEPMPSMPVFFWADPDMARYREAYFDTYPGVWRHGDWVEISDRGTAVIHGRSDATINRGGVRIGTSEIYRCLEPFDEVDQCLVVDLPRQGSDGWIVLFVTLAPDVHLSDELKARILQAVRAQASPRHVPDEIREVPDIPRTTNGKILEVPVKRILMGRPVAQVLNRDSLSNPSALDYFEQLGASLLDPAK
jgi:acetoacetyl-CoA synthetase